MFEFSPYKVLHNVFFITPFPLVCQPSGLWGHLKWHRAEGASILELIIPHRPSLLPTRSNYHHNRPPLQPGLVISAGGLDFIISAFFKRSYSVDKTFILHMWLHQHGIMCYAANMGLMIFAKEWRGQGIHTCIMFSSSLPWGPVGRG